MRLRHAVFAATLVVTAAAIPIADAAQPGAGIWTPHSYSLGDTPLIPVVISSRLDNGEEAVTVLGQRPAPMSSLLGEAYGSPQSVFNIGRDPLMKPANCQEQYTTVGGQPGAGPDLATAVGIRDCYF